MPVILDIDDLPKKYREQIEEKRKQRLSRKKKQKGMKHPSDDKNASEEISKPSARSKYGNRITKVNGIRFDSKKEAERYLELMSMQDAGEITELRLQVNFTLIEGFMNIDGVKIRPTVYRADFTYRQKDGDMVGEMIIEDVKSDATRKNPVYKLKKKLMELHGYTISEV